MKKHKNNIFLLTVICLLISGCNSQKAYYTLYVNNLSGEKEKIAEFYQQGNGLKDCKTLAASWEENYTPFCESN